MSAKPLANLSSKPRALPQAKNRLFRKAIIEDLLTSNNESGNALKYIVLYKSLKPIKFSQFLSSVPLGSIPELPAKSCAEIKASEGEQAVNGHYWLDPYNTGKNEWTNCYLETKGLFFLFFNNFNADVSNNSQI